MLNTEKFDKVVLFDGKNLDKWQHKDGNPANWEIKDGKMTVTEGAIFTKEKFEDVYLHLEFSVPHMPDKTGQAKGNSGVFLKDRYEIQILDSYGYEVPGKSDCGSIYNMYAPLVNACKPAKEWQTYDILFRAARFDDNGEILEKPRMTVIHNNILIQNNVKIINPTRKPGPIKPGSGPLMLQDHGDPVSFRNIWLAKLPLNGSDLYEPK
ncbi:MAG: 3-keto-disaccharide hydrolase [Bacillota bacterium]